METSRDPLPAARRGAAEPAVGRQRPALGRRGRRNLRGVRAATRARRGAAGRARRRRRHPGRARSCSTHGAVAPRRRPRLGDLHHGRHPALPAPRRGRSPSGCSSPGRCSPRSRSTRPGARREETPGAAAGVGRVAVLAGVAMIVRAQGGAVRTPGAPGSRCAARRRGAAGPGRDQRPAAGATWTRRSPPAPSFVVAAAVMLVVLAATPRRGLARLSARPPAVVGLARRPLRRHVCDIGLPADPGDRRRAHDRPQVAGQQLASIFVDATGSCGCPARRPVPPALGGVAVLLAGVALVQDCG